MGGRAISDREPVHVIGEIGINHNASTNMTKKRIDGAIAAKFVGSASADRGDRSAMREAFAVVVLDHAVQ